MGEGDAGRGGNAPRSSRSLSSCSSESRSTSSQPEDSVVLPTSDVALVGEGALRGAGDGVYAGGQGSVGVERRNVEAGSLTSGLAGPLSAHPGAGVDARTIPAPRVCCVVALNVDGFPPSSTAVSGVSRGTSSGMSLDSCQTCIVLSSAAFHADGGEGEKPGDKGEGA